MSQSRKLAAIIFTDIVGYTALMGNDEEKAFALLNKNRELHKPIISQYDGKWIKELGDGVMASFNTVTDAVNAAIKIQEACHAANEYQLRIGIHLGEVVVENDDVFGDGVNIASRIQAIAHPGSIFISDAVYQNISNKKDFQAKFVGEETLKNVKDPVRIYEVVTAFSTAIPGVKPFVQKLKKIPVKSIAVLPFINMSNDPDQEYFSDGMAEEILNSLTHLKDLKVAGRTASFQYKGKNFDLHELGERLGVTKVLEGSVRRQGNRLRITAQLINIEDGFHLWSEKYDRDMDDIFAIQDEIAIAITEKLKVTLQEFDREQMTKSYTENTQAYQLYLKGRYFWNKRNVAGLETSIKYYKEAIALDPNYAIAWVGIADSYNILCEYGGYSRKNTFPLAKAALNKALEIDATLGEAHISLAMMLSLYEWDWIGAGKEYKLGFDLNPNYATGHHWYSEWLMYTGRFEESLREISLAAELDPVSLGIIKDKAFVFYYNRQYDKAIYQANKTIEADPLFAASYRTLSLAYLAKGMYDKAIEENKHWGELTGNHFKTAIGLALIYATSGRMEEARKLVVQFEGDEAIVKTDYRGMALVYVALGDKEKAFGLLEKSFQQHDISLCSLKVDPKFDGLRADPRFEELVQRMNFPDKI
ncbi:adenylate/guanylate cyclase domain-containing protein [Flavihumibacter fluvii]|uniref:adenylate/guanylate cyclase domain-containing protein n=1 Tax=Flavihumibacter fluvii TaxID=2838157 RepID=UPI001BDF4D69|nr:adenylate/guanylate cyclase domain-containing protein [Flavihumibacter fluvii]ULQ54570.1 hypothetical protein KJS93_09580 [Flavihumibacter fluvii]